MILVSILQVLQTISYLILALFCIMFIIVLYEFGHYLAGKVLGFKIIEFGVGFGPPFYKRESKKNGEVFLLAQCPLAGFVNLNMTLSMKTRKEHLVINIHSSK